MVLQTVRAEIQSPTASYITSGALSAPQHSVCFSFQEKAEAYAYLGFKVFSKTASILSYSTKIVGVFSKIPNELGETVSALKCLKIIKGMLAITVIPKVIIKLVKADGGKTRFFQTLKLANCISRIVSAVETVFFYLKELKVVSSEALAWTNITGYVFLPLSVIGTAVATYQLKEIVSYNNEFRAKFKVLKTADQTHTCKLLIAEEKHLRKYKIITGECPLNGRMQSILSRLTSDNVEIKKGAHDEAIKIRKCLKNRLTERVGFIGVKTSLSIAGLACTVISLACPPAVIPITVISLVIAAAGIANFAHAQFVPKGDITDGEKRMFFTATCKKAKNIAKAMQNAYRQLVQKIAPKPNFISHKTYATL